MLGTVGMVNAVQVTYNFDNITSNNAGDATIGETQLSMIVKEDGAEKVLFTFINSGSAASSVTNICFDDVVPFDLNYNSLSQGDGVKFIVDDAKNSVLPGGNGNPLNFTVDYVYSAVSPRPKNGINPGEQLSIVFNYANGSNFGSIISNLDNRNIRVGVHVQAFESAGSESFINIPHTPPPTSVPEPSSISLMLLGFSILGGAAFFRRKK
jgi:hypothetical protein